MNLLIWDKNILVRFLLLKSQGRNNQYELFYPFRCSYSYLNRLGTIQRAYDKRSVCSHDDSEN